MGIADPSKRLEAMPPYMFAELERRVAEKRAAGIDVISLGIGDPDEPTYPHIVEAMQEAVADPANQKYPSNRGRAEFREAFADFYDRALRRRDRPRERGDPGDRRQGVHLQPLLRLPRPRRRRARLRPRLPGLHRRPDPRRRDAGAAAAACPSWASPPTSARSPPRPPAKARLMFLNYPNNPTGAVVPEGFFELVVSFAREHEILVVHDNAYSETTYDGYVAPSFLATPGRQGGRRRGLLALQGLQHDRLALRGDPRQRRGDPDLLAAEDQRRLRPLRGGAAGRRRGAARARAARWSG